MGLREEKKTQQRKGILDAAVALFRKHGYQQTRVRDIVDRLRISEATFFNYFPTKDAVLNEFALSQLDLMMAALRTALERHDQSVPDRIRNLMMNQWAREWASDREFYALVTSRTRLLSGPRGAMRKKALLLYDLYEELFSEGQRRGEIRTDAQPLQLAEMLEGILTIIAGNWLVGWFENRTEPLEKRFENAVNIFLDGCAPPKLAASRRAAPSRRSSPN